MMVAVHAAIGALCGAGIQNKPGAVVGGAASHLICDMVPHRDYPIKIEAPLAAVMFGYLIWRYGLNSPQVWGALGAVLPDGENALYVLGLLPGEWRVFPTHNEKSPYYIGHGQAIESPASQAVLSVLALLLAGRGK